MLKTVLYAYMNNIYSCRKVEKSLTRDIHFIWLAGYEKPDYRIINRFHNRVKYEINRIFTQIVLILATKGFISLDVEYVDGTKIESKASRYTFVWRKNVECNRAQLLEKIRILLQQVDDVIAQDNAYIDDSIEFTPSILTDMISELKCSLGETSDTSARKDKKVKRQKAKQLKQLEFHHDKLAEYDRHMRIFDRRNSYSKTDPDATFMRMKEDHMKDRQTNPGYNLQSGTENQFLVDFALFPNLTDTLMIPFETSFMDRYGHFPSEEIADSSYGSEENYRFIEENRIEAYVKYNFFHKKQRLRYVSDPFRQKSFHYNGKEGLLCVSHGTTYGTYRCTTFQN